MWTRIVFFLFFVLLLLSFEGVSWASNERSLLKNKLGDGKTANFSYSRVVIRESLYEQLLLPQLKEMNDDFYRLLEAVHPSFDRIARLRPLITELQEMSVGREGKGFKYHRLLTAQQIERLGELFIQLDIEIFSWLSYQGGENSLTQEGRWQLESPLQFMSETIYKAGHKVQKIVMRSSGNVKSCNDDDDLLQLLHELQLGYEQLFMKGLSLEIQEDYLALWNQYLRVLFTKIIPENNVLLFTSRLEELNFAWNYFLRKQMKERKNLSTKESIAIQTMQNRWNGILRYIFESK